MHRAALGKRLPERLDDLYRFARCLERMPADAEDLVQECVTRALDRAEDLRDPEALRTWLFRTMHRLHIDRRRGAATRSRFVVLEGGLDELGPHSIGNLDADVLRRESAEQVERALRTLSEEQRAAIVLVDVWEFTYEETAAIVDAPIGTVRSRVFRGRVGLALALGAVSSGGSYKEGQ
jgi:RNA polymerase sigma-70 factor (ECF subfamily)